MVELHALTLQDPTIRNSQFQEDLFGRHIEAVAAKLPPETVVAVQKRGQARDLWQTAAELLAEIEAGELSPVGTPSNNVR
jgi:hypothetical protein